jgi:hypothetical protein
MRGGEQDGQEGELRLRVRSAGEDGETKGQDRESESAKEGEIKLAGKAG